MGKKKIYILLHSLEENTSEVRTLLKDRYFLGKLLLLIPLHFNHFFKLLSDEDDTFISASTKYELNRRRVQ